MLTACTGGSGGGSNPVDLPLAAPPVAFGAVAVGAEGVSTLVIRNPTSGTGTTVTAIVNPSAEVFFGTDLPALPIALPPGGRIAVTVRWRPTSTGSLSSSIEVRTDDRAPLIAPVSGNGFEPAEITHDLGFVGFEPGTSVTPEMSFDMPVDAISFTIEAAGGSRTNPRGGPVILASLIGPGGAVFVDEAAPHAGPYIFERLHPGASIAGNGTLPFAPTNLAMFQFPNSDRPGAQLVPGGGTYRFRLGNEGGTLQTGYVVRVIIERRDGANAERGRIPLNVFLAPALLAKANTASTSAHLQTLLGRADALLRQTGLGFGDVDYYDLVGTRFNTGDPNDPGELMQQSAAASRVRVNVFCVKTVLGGAAGLSAAIPGPARNGTSWSGVFILADEFFHPLDLGTILAHEIGHYLGLGHTREAPGATVPWTHDIIDDTCPGPNCVGDPTFYLMDFVSLPPGPPTWTPGQMHVIRRNVLVEPGLPTFVPGAIIPGLSALQSATFHCANCNR